MIFIKFTQSAVLMLVCFFIISCSGNGAKEELTTEPAPGSEISADAAFEMLAKGGIWRVQNKTDKNRFLTQQEIETEFVGSTDETSIYVTKPRSPRGMLFKQCGQDESLQFVDADMFVDFYTNQCVFVSAQEFKILETGDGISIFIQCYTINGLFNNQLHDMNITYKRLGANTANIPSYSSVNIISSPFTDLSNDGVGCVETNKVVNLEREGFETYEITLRKPWANDSMELLFEANPNFQLKSYESNDSALTTKMLIRVDESGNLSLGEDTPTLTVLDLSTGTLTIESFTDSTGSGFFQYFDEDGAEISGNFNYDYSLGE